ncbi:MAG: DUF3592 domain-containing protein, partial [Clostridia bacterium]|nr:DUF3592 domain-containing protein [Clostridia bacterium]
MKKAVKRWEFWVSTVGLLIAAGLWIFAICFTVEIDRKYSSYTHIEATVIDYELVRSNSGTKRRSHYYAVVEYKVDGKTYKARDNMSAVSLKVGVKRKIAYNPDDPAECVFLYSENSLIVFLFCFGACFAAAGTVTAVVFVKNLKREKLMNTYSNAKFITSAATKEQF